ncbi:MAG: helix-turn-helix transcriptional regulator [Planctomycetaceae bacterium]
MAADFDLGEQAFRKKFKRLTGITPAQYRARRLIEQACVMLEQGDDTCRTIARQLGFESEFYFSRRFKQLMGRSPREYRRHSALTRAARPPEP